MLEPLTRETLPDQVTRALKRFIVERQLLPGDQLPSERELTEMLGVSRTVVREALQSLVAEGLLVKEVGRGAYVRDFVPQLPDAHFSNGAGYVASNRDLMEVRAALEIGALAFVAQRITSAELDRLQAAVAAMRRTFEKGQPLGEVDATFHDILFAAIHNPSFAYIKRLIQDAAIGGALGAQTVRATYARPADRNSVETAERIVEALHQRNADEAQRAMRSHLLIERPPDHARLYLFVDDGNIAAIHNVRRRIGTSGGAAHKFPHNPLLVPEHAWEGDSVFPSATVLYEPEAMTYRLWYHGSRQLSPREELCSLCYATSNDGIHWTKPELGIFADPVPQRENGTDAEDESPRNNLVMPWGDTQRGDAISATILPGTATNGGDQPYRMLYLSAGAPGAGVHLAISPDGLHWSPNGENRNGENRIDTSGNSALPVGDALVVMAGQDTHGFFSSAAPHEFSAYYRLPLRVASQPTLCRMQSNDLQHWRGHRAVLSADEQDPPDTELHGLTPFRYGDLTLGLLWVYSRSTNRSELQLVSSRDGEQWTRVGDRSPLLTSGAPGAFDHLGVTRPTAPIVVGNELWFYYAGIGKQSHIDTPTQQIGLATLTIDRFVALEAGAEEGYVITSPIDCSTQTHILLNAVVNAGGYILVEALEDTPSQAAIPGYTREDAVPFDGNAVYHRVAWRNHTDLSALGPRTVRLRFIFCRAAIYGFRLAHPEASVNDLLAGIC